MKIYNLKLSPTESYRSDMFDFLDIAIDNFFKDRSAKLSSDELAKTLEEFNGMMVSYLQIVLARWLEKYQQIHGLNKEKTFSSLKEIVTTLFDEAIEVTENL